MKAHVVELEGSVHHRVQKLLPWMVTGQLADTEETLVQEHVAACQQCSEDLAWQRKLRAVQPAAGASPDMEGALARLMPRIETRDRAANGPWMRWALAAQLLVIAGLGAQLTMQDTPEYRLLGAQGAASANLVVVFKPETTEEQLRGVLKSNSATVVGGPTSTNAWLLSVPPPGLDDALVNMRASAAVSLAEPLQAAK